MNFDLHQGLRPVFARSYHRMNSWDNDLARAAKVVRLSPAPERAPLLSVVVPESKRGGRIRRFRFTQKKKSRREAGFFLIVARIGLPGNPML